MTIEASNLVTAGDIADALKEKFSRVRYILDRRPIEPVQRAGRTHLYKANAVDLVRAELAAIEARRSTTAPAA